MSAIKFRYHQKDLPPFFDARDKWPGKIEDIRDQGWCGASWAFSTASVASDRWANMPVYVNNACYSNANMMLTCCPFSRFRFAIEGQSEAELSVQSLLSCNTQGQNGCRGGYVDRAWNYLRRFG